MQQQVFSNIALEKTFDVIPAGTLVAGRGGVTKTGARVYSETDDGPTAFMKSLVHIFKGVRPTAIDTTEKIVKGIEKNSRSYFNENTYFTFKCCSRQPIAILVN